MTITSRWTCDPPEVWDHILGTDNCRDCGAPVHCVECGGEPDLLFEIGNWKLYLCGRCVHAMAVLFATQLESMVDKKIERTLRAREN